MTDRYYRPIPTQANCAWCDKIFFYSRTTRPRQFCDPCIPLVAAENVGDYCRRKDASDLQSRCLAIAEIVPLFLFPRGFAADKWGPFFPLRTIQGLLERGRLSMAHEINGKRRMFVRAI